MVADMTLKGRKQKRQEKTAHLVIQAPTAFAFWFSTMYKP